MKKLALQLVMWNGKKYLPYLLASIEKQSYLVATVIKYLFFLKLPLFIYFVFSLDLIANVIPGAMCAAGVVNATPYGYYLFILKIINLYLFGIWLAIHHYDMQVGMGHDANLAPPSFHNHECP